MQMTAHGKKLSTHQRRKKLFYLLAFSLLFSGSCYAQELDLSLKKVSLEKAFREIESKVPQRFVYTREMLEQSQPVTINIRNASLQKVLDLVFEGQPLSYLVDDGFIKVKLKTGSGSLTQNNINLQGIVTDEKGEPLIGATVSIKGTDHATATNSNGTFVLLAVSEKDILLISNVGYAPKEIPLNGKRQIAVQLSVLVSEMDKAIIIGYGTTTRRLNTGGVTKVSAEEIMKQPISNPLAALQGRVPGLLITQSSGIAGSSFKVEIRGQSILDASLSRNDPLIIIDGVPFESGNIATNQLTSAANNPTSISQGGLSPLNTINPSDIESIEVLKDADATAIYGSRGANGVILITTKKAKNGKTSFTANIYQGWSKVMPTMPLLNTQQYISMRREGFANEGQTPDITTAPDLLLWDTTRYTDLKKMLIGNIAHTTSVQTSLEGGNAETQFLFSANYRREGSVFNSTLKDQIASGRLQLHHLSTDKRFDFQITTSYSSDVNNLIQTDLTRFINLPPNVALNDSNGKLAWSEKGVFFSSINSDFSNPLAELLKKYRSENRNFLSNLILSYKIGNHLIAKISGGYNHFNTDEVAINPSTSLDPALNLLPFSAFANSSQQSWIAEPQLQWNNKVKRNNFSMLVGGTFQDKSFNSEAISATNYTNDLLLYSIRGAATLSAINNDADYRYTAIFGRFHYDWANRYIINVTGRQDGSSRFAPESRFSLFGSVGAAWVFSSEKWIKVPLISFGKVRASYGVTGNDQIGDYRFLNLWTNTSQPYGGIPGLMPKSLYNPTYNWEKNKKVEVALEMSILKDRIQYSIGYYQNRSDNQLVNYTLPTQTGFFSVVQNLPALVQNSGFEIVASASPVKIKDWNWFISFNVTAPKNKLISFPGLSTSPYANQYTEGASLNSIKRLKFLGTDATTGIYSFEDIDKDGLLTDKDYQLLGNLDPKFYGGLSNSVTYKTFTLSFLIEFRKQLGKNYLSQLSYSVPGTIYNQPTIVLNRWQRAGDQTNIERFSSQPFGTAYTGLSYLNLSNGIYSDASFARLKNAYLSWQCGDKWLHQTHLKNGKIFVEAQNLLTVTRYKGTDPESQNFFVVPPLRTIAIGIQLTF